MEQASVSADSTLAEATPPSKGRFWLRSGKILSATLENQPPQVGESWGYPDATIPDWVAKTDLLVYHLPQQYEELASTIAPEIFLHKQQKEDTGTQGEGDTGRRRRRRKRGQGRQGGHDGCVF